MGVIQWEHTKYFLIKKKVIQWDHFIFQNGVIKWEHFENGGH